MVEIEQQPNCKHASRMVDWLHYMNTLIKSTKEPQLSEPSGGYTKYTKSYPGLELGHP